MPDPASLGTMHGRASLSHAAMYAMAASHSFDVTLGIPLATELFPTLLPYVDANQVALSLARPHPRPRPVQAEPSPSPPHPTHAPRAPSPAPNQSVQLVLVNPVLIGLKLIGSSGGANP